MKATRDKYLKNFFNLMEESYMALKEGGSMPPERKGFIDGFIDVGRMLDLASYDEFVKIIEEANYKVFGMDVAERKKVFEEKPLSREEYLEIPTIIRKGRKFKITS